MFKRLLLPVLFLSTFTVCFADTNPNSAESSNPLWHCTANNTKGAVWNRYATTRAEARSLIEKQCAAHNDRKSCEMVCFPPRVYWRCLSHDTVPLDNNPKTGVQPKRGTWFWTSFSRQVAINGARDACRHNSAFGGCYVDPNSCASS